MNSLECKQFLGATLVQQSQNLTRFVWRRYFTRNMFNRSVYTKWLCLQGIIRQNKNFYKRKKGDGIVGAWLITNNLLNLWKHSLMVGSFCAHRLVGKNHIYADSWTLEAFMFNQEHGFQDLIVTNDLQIPFSVSFLFFSFRFTSSLG